MEDSVAHSNKRRPCPRRIHAQIKNLLGNLMFPIQDLKKTFIVCRFRCIFPESVQRQERLHAYMIGEELGGSFFLT